MRNGLKATAGVAIAALAAIFFLTSQNGTETRSTTHNESTAQVAHNLQPEGSDSALIDAIDNDRSVASGEEATVVAAPRTKVGSERNECVEFDSYALSPDAQVIDEWYLSWGAPPLINNNLGTRPYIALDEAQLTVLASSGDADALQELGKNRIWRAFHNERRMPDYATLWDAGSDEHPFRTNISQDLLEEGRGYLYDAAIKGNVYSFVDISLSFSQEISAARKAGRLTPELEKELSVNAASYAALPEELIDGLFRGFVSTTIDDESKPDAENLRKEIVDQYKVDRIESGLAALPEIRSPPQLQSIPKFCRH